jgi:hypothetical protein
MSYGTSERMLHAMRFVPEVGNATMHRSWVGVTRHTGSTGEVTGLP